MSHRHRREERQVRHRLRERQPPRTARTPYAPAPKLPRRLHTVTTHTTNRRGNRHHRRCHRRCRGRSRHSPPRAGPCPPQRCHCRRRRATVGVAAAAAAVVLEHVDVDADAVVGADVRVRGARFYRRRRRCEDVVRLERHQNKVEAFQLGYRMTGGGVRARRGGRIGD